MNPTWTDITIAIATVVIALAAVVIGWVELLRSKRQHKFEKDRSDRRAAFEHDRLMREWRQLAARLIVSPYSASHTEIRITNWSELPFRRVSIRVIAMKQRADGPDHLASANFHLIGPGEEVKFDFRTDYEGNPVDPIQAHWWVEFSDYEDRRWRYENYGKLFLIDEIKSSLASVPQVVFDVEPLERYGYAED